MRATIDTVNKTISVEQGTLEEVVVFVKRNFPKEWKTYNIVSAYPPITWNIPFQNPQEPFTYTDFSTSNKE